MDAMMLGFIGLGN
jgi:hypothetical protein